MTGKKHESYLETTIDPKTQVFYLTLNRPDKHNAFNGEMIDELVACASTIKNNENLRALVIQGKGKSFCAGADLNWMKAAAEKNYEENIADAELLNQLFVSFAELNLPIITVVQGLVFGGGLGLVSVSDVVISREDAKFCFSEVKLGLIPAVISPYVLDKIPYSLALAYFTSGKVFLATEAKHMNLVHQVVQSEDESQDSLNDWLKNYLEASPQAVRWAKSLTKEIQQQLRIQGESRKLSPITTRQISMIRQSEEAKEGMSALLEKRMAAWRKS